MVFIADHQVLFETDGIVPLVLKTMATGSAVALQVSATAAANLALRSLDIAERLVGLGVTPSIGAMLRHELDEVRERAAGLVEVLTFSDENKAALLSAEIVRPLVEMLLNGTGNYYSNVITHVAIA